MRMAVMEFHARAGSVGSQRNAAIPERARSAAVKYFPAELAIAE
jgi:hypothetical protein